MTNPTTKRDRDIFVSLLVVVALWSGMYRIPSCQNKASGCIPTMYREYRSPQGRFVAIVYGLDCGGKAGGDQIDIQSSPGILPTVRGNLLSADGKEKIELVWTTESTLEVRRKRSDGMWNNEVQVKSGWFQSDTIRVEYRN